MAEVTTAPDFKRDIYKRYNRVVALACKRSHWLMRRETISQSDLSQAVWVRLIQRADFSYDPSKVGAFIRHGAWHVCCREGAKSQMLRIPDHAFIKICRANRGFLSEDETHALLKKPGNRFPENLSDKDIDVPAPDTESYNRGMYSLKDTLVELVKKLNPKCQLVMALRYGLGDLPIQSLEDIGKILGCTRQRVCQIEEKAIRRLRQLFLKTDVLDEYQYDRLSRIPHDPDHLDLHSTTYPEGAIRPLKESAFSKKPVDSRTLYAKIHKVKRPKINRDYVANFRKMFASKENTHG